MIIKKRGLGVMTLLPLGVLLPATGYAQRAPAYDTTTEATFKGTVTEVKTHRPGASWFARIHTLGLAHTGAQEQQLLLKTDTGTVEIHLGPTEFLTAKKVEIGKHDTLAVRGSRIMLGESPVVLAREVRKGDSTWTLRDSTGRPLWSSSLSEPRGFWTTKRVLVAIAVVKVVALATVLRH
jgi:hypothetical protein